MAEAFILVAAIGGSVIGWIFAKKASADSLCRAHARGLWEGRSEREWELNALQLRIRKLEADVRRYGGSNRNGIGA